MTSALHGTLSAGPWRLRPLQLDDAPFLFTVMNDPGMVRVRSAQPPATVKETEAWVRRALTGTDKGTYLGWMLFEEASIEPAGLVVLQDVDMNAGTAEAGYFVAPEFRRRGAATAALGAVGDWAFGALGLHRIVLLHDTDNKGSCWVATAAGFRPEGVLRESRLRSDGTRCDEELHARLRSDTRSGSEQGRSGRDKRSWS